MPVDHRVISTLHIITSLYTAGAEMMLYKLLTATDQTRFSATVVSLLDRGTLGNRIEAAGVPVHALALKANPSLLRAPWQLRGIARQNRPSVIQGWMYHGNVAALLARHFMPDHRPLVWNIRNSLSTLTAEKPLTALCIRLGAQLSRRPAAIIYNSYKSAEQHEALGYEPSRTLVIPNGFDTAHFKPSVGARVRIHRALRCAEEVILIGLIARYHPMKDHRNFLRAATTLASQHTNVRFVLAGRNVDPANQELAKVIREAGLAAHVRLLGERNDIAELTAGLDIATSSSSWGEGFPNVIGEAMACAVPCVVTDVGDSAAIVGNTGIVVLRRNPEALAAGWKTMIEIGTAKRQQLGEAARRRIAEHYALDQVVKQYEHLYETLTTQG